MAETVVANGAGEKPEVRTFNALGVPDGQFRLVKDVHTPIKFLDFKVGTEWVTAEELDVGGLIVSVSITDADKSKDQSGQIDFWDPDGSLIESELISEGVEVRIGMGFLGNVRDFGSWLIETVDPSIGDDALTLSCKLKSKAAFMDRNATSARYDNLTAGEIARIIGEKYGLDPEGVVDPGEAIKEFSQGLESDTSVLDKLAQAYGYQWYVADNKLIFREQKPTTSEIKLVYRPGKETQLLDFGQLKRVSYSCDKKKNSGKGSSTKKINSKAGVLMEAVSDLSNDPEIRAQQEYFKSLGEEPIPLEEFYGYVDAEGNNQPFTFYMNSLDLDADGAGIFSTRLTAAERKSSKGCTLSADCSYGIPDLVAGIMVPILGIGKKYSGLYKVVKATHTYGTDGYTTSFEGECSTRARGNLGITGSRKGGKRGQVGTGDRTGIVSDAKGPRDISANWEAADMPIREVGE